MARITRRMIEVTVMRPRRGEAVVQVFEPEYHEGTITMTMRHGVFNATAEVGGEATLNNRMRRKMMRMLREIGQNRRGGALSVIGRWKEKVEADLERKRRRSKYSVN